MFEIAEFVIVKNDEKAGGIFVFPAFFLFITEKSLWNREFKGHIATRVFSDDLTNAGIIDGVHVRTFHEDPQSEPAVNADDHIFYADAGDNFRHDLLLLCFKFAIGRTDEVFNSFCIVHGCCYFYG